MRNMKSMLLTFLCALVIVGLGYLGIVEQGKQILRSESVPEKAEYENVGSNIFYGKIEDDIEIFPWNYYPENAVKQEFIPNFIVDDAFGSSYLLDEGEAADMAEQIVMESEGVMSYLQAQGYVAADIYFAEMIAYGVGVEEEEVLQYFRKSGNHIMQNIVLSEDSYIGAIYFYQNVLTLGGTRYQVRIACSDWNVINFSCTEYSVGDKREREDWKSGKEKMVTMLEQSEGALSKYFSYMAQLKELGAPDIYYIDGKYENAYLSGFQYLGYLTSGIETEEIVSAELEMDMVAREWRYLYYGDMYEDTYEKAGGNEEEYYDTGKAAAAGTEEQVEYSVNYSYQVVELKDTILLLVQGDVTMGLYYDPMNQKFCGYNFFYEY